MFRLYGNPAQNDPGEWLDYEQDLDSGTTVQFLCRQLSPEEHRQIEAAEKTHKFRVKRGGTEINRFQQERVNVSKAVCSLKDSRHCGVTLGDREALQLFGVPEGTELPHLFVLDGNWTDDRKRAFLERADGVVGMIARFLERGQQDDAADEEDVAGN